MILANKSDMEEDVVVTEQELEAFEKEKGIKIIRTSAKSGNNVDESFLDLTKKLIIKRSKASANGGNEDKRNKMGLAFQKLTLGKGNKDENNSNGGGGGCGCI